MLMQVLTRNSKIKFDATFAVPGTRDCNGVEGRRSSRALSTARCGEVHVPGQNDRTIYRSERRCCSCHGYFVGLSVAQLFLICSTAAASSSSMMLRI